MHKVRKASELFIIKRCCGELCKKEMKLFL